ncbi:MAG: alpha/beta fold hydrolase [Polyangiaceae bacterium]|nr:alpha/beta fold hydrolase [Polyangiaceae bacterium]
MRQSRNAAALLALAISAAACNEPSGPVRTLQLGPCTLPGVRSPAQCGTLHVPENRNQPNGRTLGIQVIVVPALAASPKADPVVFLAGGPGQAASQIVGFALGVADKLHESRDFVFVDQRGTGHSHALFCEVPPSNAPLYEHFDSQFDPAVVERCRDAQDADLTQYTTAVATQDLEDVRHALGYPQLNLWGTSYGTRAALAYMRAYPNNVRSSILDGVAPMALVLPVSLAKDAERALNQLFVDCAAEQACAGAFPNLKERFYKFVQTLADEPLRVQVRHPKTGVAEEVVIDKATFLGALRGVLYSAEISTLLPFALNEAMSGRFEPLITLAAELGKSTERTFAVGMFLSVVCSEDIPFIKPGEIEAAAQNTLFGPQAALDIVRACDYWPKAPVPAAFREPVQTNLPTLLLSGALDPVTPPSWGELAQASLPNGVHVIVGGTGHNTVSTACARRIASQFVEDGNPSNLNTECASTVVRPPFFPTFAGSP